MKTSVIPKFIYPLNAGPKILIRFSFGGWDRTLSKTDPEICMEMQKKNFQVNLKEERSEIK